MSDDRRGPVQQFGPALQHLQCCGPHHHKNRSCTPVFARKPDARWEDQRITVYATTCYDGPRPPVQK
jgi:hypothetical protein